MYQNPQPSGLAPLGLLMDPDPPPRPTARAAGARTPRGSPARRMRVARARKPGWRRAARRRDATALPEELAKGVACLEGETSVGGGRRWDLGPAASTSSHRPCVTGIMRPSKSRHHRLPEASDCFLGALYQQGCHSRTTKPSGGKKCFSCNDFSVETIIHVKAEFES
ncbi:hypothetical protein GUJ93_ZPchr0005g14694 [Zizania palustris]|uniref:Uncharacterized protein n=1 Tax=Zizania palustris TaxID=103762 RepID=A0A8J5S3H5_ZIZPA|nr:hypothetical protein GUJ93_ZPchr0005g14694 [Zizania palustris]